MSGAFTAGPLMVASRHSFDPGTFAVEATAADTNNGQVVALCYGPQAEANARLIAAAPELYDSIDVPNLRKAAELIRFAGSTLHAGLLTMMADKQERALAKARGEQ